MSYENTMNTAADRAFDWDEGFDNSAGTFLLLAEQDCPFEVIKLERQRYEGGAKMGPCKMALLTIRLYGKEGVATVTHRLYLHTKTIGLLSAFFISIGQAKPDDEVIRPRWDRIEGAKGRCHVGIHEFVKKSGPHAGETGQSNEITRFLPPAEQPAQPAPQQAAQPVPQQGEQLSWKMGAF